MPMVLAWSGLFMFHHESFDRERRSRADEYPLPEARCEDFLHVRGRGVVGDARHRLARALREGQAQNLRAALRVVAEHFVEVAEAEQKQRVWRQRAAHLHVLLHHGGQPALAGLVAFGHLR